MNRAFGRFLAIFALVGAVNLPAQTLVDLGGVVNDGGAFVNFGIADSSNNERVAMPLQALESFTTSQVAVQLAKVGSPSDNAVIEVRRGSPDGALLASGSVAGSAISASGSRHVLTFPALVVPLGSTVAVVYSRSGASDPRNFYKAVRGTNGSSYGIVNSGGYMYLRTGMGWGGSNLANSPIVSVFGSLVSLGQATVSPGSSVNFGDVTVGQTAPRQFRIKNTGTAALPVTAVSSDNGVFTLSPAIPPNVSVNVGDSITVVVSFTPTAAGAVSGAITVSHDGVNSPAIVPVSGTGVISSSSSGGGGSGGSAPPPPSPPVPGITLLPSSLAMDSVAVGGPGSHETFEIVNDSSVTLNISSISVGGENSSEFLVSMNSAVIEAGGRRIAVVSFFPVTAGAKSAVINIAHNAPGGVSTVPLAGIAGAFSPGSSGAAISVAPQSVNFDTVGVGSSRTLNVTVSNTGTAPLVISGIILGGADPSHFSLSRTSLMVDPGQSRFISVTFSPVSVGPKSATLVLANNTATPAATVPLTGTTPVFFAVPRVNLSVDRQEGAAPLTVRFANTNAGGLINRWEWQPGDRTSSGISSTVTVVRNSNGDTLTYTYNRPGVYRPILAVFGPGGGDAQYLADSIVVLSPPPPRPVLRVDLDSLGMGAIDVGGGIVSNIRVFNTGTAELAGRITLDGDNSFGVASADSLRIPAGGEGRTVAVRFTPRSAGVKLGRLVISHNGDPGERVIILTGEGLAAGVVPRPAGPRLEISAVELSLGSIFAARDTSFANVVFRNSGDAVLTGTWFLVSPDTSFSVSSDTVSLAAGLSDTVVVAFVPRTAGSKRGQLYFFHNAAVGPHGIDLVGEARRFTASAEMADFDSSGMVDFTDFFLLMDEMGRSSPSPAGIRIFDLNGDGRLDATDFFVFTDFFGTTVAR